MKQDAGIRLVGSGRTMLALKREIERVAACQGKVLITGESGVGKELVAHALHRLSPRRTRPFVTVNCAGIAETLLESELFGHNKGSFTDAYRDKPGTLEMADTGTVFLDEVGEMTPRMQALFLRFLETGEIQKIGADAVPRIVDVWVLAGTNRSLADMVAAGDFRADLFYRLNVIHLHVPALRDRREDIPELVDHLLSRHAGGRPLSVSPEAMAALLRYRWPGNVRELQNVVERLAVTCRGVVLPDDLPPEVRGAGPSEFSVSERRTVADELLRRMLEDHESFWSAVYPLYMRREVTRSTVREVVRRGLERARGNYRVVTRMFNMELRDYKRFLSFLRKQGCLLPFKEYRC